MKKSLILVLFTLIGVRIWAQQAKLEVRTGISLPLFAYSSYNLEEGCFTLPGLSVTAATDIHLWHRLGLKLEGGLQMHPVDVGVLGWEKVQADPFLTDMFIRSDPYRIIHLVAGPNYYFPVMEKLKLDVSAFGGVFFSRTPYQLYKPVYYMVGPDYYEITPSKDISFAWGAGFRLRYAITDSYELSAGADYMQSAAAFGFNTSNGLRIDNRTISYLNTTAGVVFYLF
jgi:hypothetical protein